MVQPKVTSETPARAARRHYDPIPPNGADLFRETVAVAFASGARPRLAGLGRLLRTLIGLVRAR